MPHTHDNATGSSIDDARCSCALAPALATGFPITCRRLGFRSGCCKYVEQCKTAIYWDLALDFTLVRLAIAIWLKTDRLLFSKSSKVPESYLWWWYDCVVVFFCPSNVATFVRYFQYLCFSCLLAIEKVLYLKADNFLFSKKITVASDDCWFAGGARPKKNTSSLK